ncbi:MAG: hypothetical protein HC894_09780 [Microcoleus sp. SM1_3_4]|nr:hypothetical protein [Microcoleus sp. SM1_3_4]
MRIETLEVADLSVEEPAAIRKLMLTFKSDRDYPTPSAYFCYGMRAKNPVAAKTLSVLEAL